MNFIRNFVARLFGFDSEISNLETKIAEMGFDEAFGIFTRYAFQHLASKKTSGWLAFLDLNKIHDLNISLGYEEVNRRIRTIFTCAIRKTDFTAGRYFSGDEIVILLDAVNAGHASAMMDRLEHEAKNQDITFFYAMEPWNPSQNLSAVVDRLSKIVFSKKEQRDDWQQSQARTARHITAALTPKQATWPKGEN